MKTLILALMVLPCISARAAEIFIECKTKGYEEQADIDLAERNFILAISPDGKQVRYLNSESKPLVTTEDRYQWVTKSAPNSGSNVVIVEEINRVSGKYKSSLVQKDSANQVIGKDRLIGRGDCAKVDKKL